MKIFIIGLICVVSPFLSFSHNPLSARYHLETGANGSLLTINLSQNGIDHALLKKYGKDKLEEINQNEFKELIVDYIKSNFNLSVDKEKVALKKGGIKLGNHQTDLKFMLPPISEQAKSVVVDISAFKENDNHQTIFSHNLKGEVEHVILSSKNDYHSVILSNATPTHSNNWYWFALIGLLALGLVMLLKVQRTSKVATVSI